MPVLVLPLLLLATLSPRAGNTAFFNGVWKPFATSKPGIGVISSTPHKKSPKNTSSNV